MTIFERMVDKCMSGRFILTVIAGVVFLYCAVTKSIEGATVTAILMMIFKEYFDRNDRGKPA